MRGCFIPNHLESYLYGMSSRFDEQGVLFKRMQKWTFAKIKLMWLIIERRDFQNVNLILQVQITISQGKQLTHIMTQSHSVIHIHTHTHACTITHRKHFCVSSYLWKISSHCVFNIDNQWCTTIAHTHTHTHTHTHKHTHTQTHTRTHKLTRKNHTNSFWFHCTFSNLCLTNCFFKILIIHWNVW